MIHHISIPARDPVFVASVLAELIGGKAFPFGGPLDGAHMAVSGDPHGTMIEVYPETIILRPGESDQPATFIDKKEAAGHAAFHALISVPLDQPAVERLGERVGWRTRFFHRGPPGKPLFSVIEFWVENRVMLEVATQDMLAPYAAYMQLETLQPAVA